MLRSLVRFQLAPPTDLVLVVLELQDGDPPRSSACVEDPTAAGRFPDPGPTQPPQPPRNEPARCYIRDPDGYLIKVGGKRPTHRETGGPPTGRRSILPGNPTKPVSGATEGSYVARSSAGAKETAIGPAGRGWSSVRAMSRSKTRLTELPARSSKTGSTTIWWVPDTHRC